MRILVTGASGMLGQDIVQTFSKAGHDVIATDRAELDIADATSVQNVVSMNKPHAIINTAAYNFVDRIEDPAVYPIALSVNAIGPENLARTAAAHGIAFVHYSTDYVFAGDKPEGYMEDAITDPISKYGETKALGEKAVQEAGGTWYILRLSKLFGHPGATDGSKESFIRLMLRLAKEQPTLKIINEEVGCPTYTKDIAEATLCLLENRSAPGVYHLINEGPGVTWYEFAREIFDVAKITTPFVPVSSDAFPPRHATRPKFAALLNTRAPKLRPRIEALREFLACEHLI